MKDFSFCAFKNYSSFITLLNFALRYRVGIRQFNYKNDKFYAGIRQNLSNINVLEKIYFNIILKCFTSVQSVLKVLMAPVHQSQRIFMNFLFDSRLIFARLRS